MKRMGVGVSFVILLELNGERERDWSGHGKAFWEERLN